MNKSDQDIRWAQRFANFKNAFSQLQAAVELSNQRELSILEEQGLIQSFEYTHELAWNTLRDYLKEKGFQDIVGSKDTARLAFKEGIISDGEAWMEMIKSRNLSSYTYNKATADLISEFICKKYYPAFLEFQNKMQQSL